MIVIVCNSRAERGPLESVIAALPEARVVGFDADGLTPSDAMSNALRKFSTVLEGARLCVVLGDRYETLAAALAAMFLRVPVAHIHGGETTTGAFDDPLRHSVTHVAALHFVATVGAFQRVRDLREYHRQHMAPVYLVGAPGLDGVPGNSAKRDRKVILVTYHPETRAEDYGLAGCRAMLTALEAYSPEYEVIFCGVNADPGGDAIRGAIKDYLRRNGGTHIPTASHREYIGMMQHARLVIGNSSAGVIEAPWVGCPSVNIGRRQNGREMALSVFQDDSDIGRAIEAAMEFVGDPSPVYRGGAAPEIARICREFVR